MASNYPFEKMALPYGIAGLETQINASTMFYHYENIYGYNLTLLNYVLAPLYQYHTWTLTQLITDSLEVPITIQNRIRYLAGSVYNHELYFEMVSKNAPQSKAGPLYDKLIETYGSIENFILLFKQAAFSIFGIGFVWLVAENDGRIHMVITSDYDTPALNSVTPIFNFDTWEHAYYLQYPTQLALFMDNWFEVLDWNKVEAKFQRFLTH